VPDLCGPMMDYFGYRDAVNIAAAPAQAHDVR